MKCPFPEKKRYTKAEAKVVANKLYFTQGKQMVPYRCPAGGHSHIGHKSPFSKRWRKR